MGDQSTSETWLPHIDVLCQALGISRDRLGSRAKVAIEIGLVRLLLGEIVKNIPFDEAFYLAMYRDVAELYKAGKIRDVHQHYITIGFFEGRFPANPHVDDAFYRERYPDVDSAVTAGTLQSATHHYIGYGAAEGRSPNPDSEPHLKRWRLALEY